MKVASLFVASLLNCLFDLFGVFAQYLLLCALGAAAVCGSASVFAPKLVSYWDLMNSRL